MGVLFSYLKVVIGTKRQNKNNEKREEPCKVNFTTEGDGYRRTALLNKGPRSGSIDLRSCRAYSGPVPIGT